MPRELKQDGKFHELKVELRPREKGWSIEARKGYFATGKDEVEFAKPRGEKVSTGGSPAGIAEADAATDAGARAREKANAAGLQALAIDERVKAALGAAADGGALPVTVGVQPVAGGGQARIHLDARTMPFRKDGERSFEGLTFVVGVFDARGQIVLVKQKAARLGLAPEELAEMLRSGFDVDIGFQVTAGVYRVRAVVMESEAHTTGSASAALTVP